jgi:hypothetical protein
MKQCADERCDLWQSSYNMCMHFEFIVIVYVVLLMVEGNVMLHSDINRERINLLKPSGNFT